MHKNVKSKKCLFCRRKYCAWGETQKNLNTDLNSKLSYFVVYVAALVSYLISLNLVFLTCKVEL